MIRNLKHLVLFFTLSALAYPASALMVDTTQTPARSDRTSSAEPPERRHLVERLVESGVEPDDAALRVKRMTDTEVVELHAQFDELPAGQGVSTTNLLLIIIILILLL